jgi:hypothetical protein
VAGTYLEGSDFKHHDGHYDTFALHFSKDNGDTGFYTYKVYYYGSAESLWSDQVEYSDPLADSLLYGTWGHYVTDAVGEFRDWIDTTVYRFYLADEADVDQYNCCARVNLLLNYKGINWCPSNFEQYMAIVKPAEIYLDNYPIMGRTFGSQGAEPPPGPSQRTSVDSGASLQGRFDYMCSYLAAARQATMEQNKHFWFTVQAYGEYAESTAFPYDPAWNTRFGSQDTPWTDEGVAREPTSRELRCMSWLALAYGARGLEFFPINPCSGGWMSQKVWWLPGLMQMNPANESLWPGHHRPMFDTVRAFYANTLKEIAPTLERLKSDTVGEGDSTPVGFVTGCGDYCCASGRFTTTQTTTTSSPSTVAVKRPAPGRTW